MHEKGRDGLKRFQLFAKHDFFGEAKIEQAGSHLIGDALQQLDLFHRVGNAIDAICKNNQAEVTIAGEQGYADTISAFAKLRFTDLPQSAPPVVPNFFQSSNTARRAMATRTTNACSWKDAAPP